MTDQPPPVSAEQDDWQYTTEKVKPHGLCCKECHAARAELQAAQDELKRLHEWRKKVEPMLVPTAREKALRAERDALRQYITDFGSPQDWNRYRRLYQPAAQRTEEAGEEQHAPDCEVVTHYSLACTCGLWEAGE